MGLNKEKKFMKTVYYLIGIYGATYRYRIYQITCEQLDKFVKDGNAEKSVYWGYGDLKGKKVWYINKEAREVLQ
jgi:hypothetical protein